MNATEPMRYADALRAVAGGPAGGRGLRLLANSTTAELAVFLRAYAIARGAGWEIRHQDYGPLRAQLDAAGVTDDAQVVLVSVEDVFPELSYRADADWGHASVDALVAVAADRVATVVGHLARPIAAAGGPVVVIPPLLEVPALPVSGLAAAALARLPVTIRGALEDAFADTDVQVLDVDDALRDLARTRWRDDSLLVNAGSPFSTDAATRLAREVDRLLAPPPQARKVLVTDLDGTLWRGVYAEDGVPGISAHPHGRGQVHRVWQRLLRLLAARGVLLAVCSKNDPDVLEIFADPAVRESIGLLLTDADLAAASASWEPKSVQLRGLAERLGLGLDAFVLVDDNPVELAEVATALPDVLPLRFPGDGTGLHAFCRTVREAFAGGDPAGTDEDLRRAELYRLRDRVEAGIRSAGSTDTFLESLRMRMWIERLDGADQLASARARQLLNRTNQFNLTGHRYDEQAWRRLLRRTGSRVFVARLRDTYGDHGLCAVLVLETGADRVSIVELAVSCRVFNRTVETALLSWVTGRTGLPVVAGWQRTGRNDRVLETLLDNGFRVDLAEDDRTVVTADPGRAPSGVRSPVVVMEAGSCAS